MNWQCDVYVYEDVSGGWTTHVAARRRLFGPILDLPLMSMPNFGGKYDIPSRSMSYPSRWHKLGARIVFGFAAFWHSRVHLASLRMIPLRPIGLQFDGETFNDPSAAECASRLEWLRGLGYVVPQYAIDALRGEEAPPPVQPVRTTT